MLRAFQFLQHQRACDCNGAGTDNNCLKIVTVGKNNSYKSAPPQKDQDPRVQLVEVAQNLSLRLQVGEVWPVFEKIFLSFRLITASGSKKPSDGTTHEDVNSHSHGEHLPICQLSARHRHKDLELLPLGVSHVVAVDEAADDSCRRACGESKEDSHHWVIRNDSIVTYVPSCGEGKQDLRLDPAVKGVEYETPNLEPLHKLEANLEVDQVPFVGAHLSW